MMFSPIKNRTWKIIAGSAAAVLILIAVLLFAVPPLIERQLNRQDFGAIFQEKTGGTFTSGKFRIRLLPAPHVIVPDGRIDIPEQMGGLWRTAHVYPALSALLKGRLQVGTIILQEPEFSLSVSPSAHHDPAKPSPAISSETLTHDLQKVLSQMAAILPDAAIAIRGGICRTTGILPAPIHLEHVDLELQLPPDTMRIDLRCRSNWWASLHLSGTLQPETLEGQLQLALDQFKPQAIDHLFPPMALQWDISTLNIKATMNLTGVGRVNGTLQAHIPALLLRNGTNGVPVKNVRLKTQLAYSADGLRIDLENMQAEQPSLSLSGQATINPKIPLFEIELTGRHLTIGPLRKAAMTLAGDDETVAGIFDVLRDGKVPWIRYNTRGSRAEDMGVFRNMRINGTVENGRLFIPEAELDLTNVHGSADIAEGILEGTNLRAAYGQTKGSDGRLWLDLDQDDEVPFFLEIDVDADLAPLPALLQQWVDDRTFKEEMGRIHDVGGRAEGVLVIDGRKSTLDVTVDVSHCRFDAAYDRLPSRLSVTEGMVQYTNDRIQVIQMNGNLDTTHISGLTAHVAFGDTALIRVDNAAARIDINRIAPWLASYDMLDALPFSLQSEDGWLKLSRLELEGPLMNPAQWAFTTQGTVSRLEIISPGLPGPAEIESARFTANADKLDIPEARLLMADADLSFNETHFLFKDDRPVAAAMTVNGTLGPVAEKWASERIDLGSPWRLKAPVALSDTALTWVLDGENTFLGDITTGGGTKLSLDMKMEGTQLRHQALVVDDQDSHAELQVSVEPDHLDIDFNGRIHSATLERMMQENHYANGRMEGQFKARIYPTDPGRSTASGALQAYNIYQPLRMAHTLHIDELSLKAQDNKVLLEPAVLVVDNQTHRVTGSIDIEAGGYVLDLVHTATNFSLSLPEAPSSDKPPVAPDTFSIWDLPLRGRIVSRLDAFTLGKLQWSPFNATVQIDPRNWHFRIEDAALCGLATTGDIRITPDKISITLQPEAMDKKLDPTMACLVEKPNLIDGQFDLTGHLETQGAPDQLSRFIDGQMEFTAKEGRIYRFNLLSKTLAVVNVTELFRGKVPDLMEGGLAYNQIDISVDIADSLLTIREAVIDGASANIAGQGTVNLVTGDTDMIILVAPFKTVDAIVRYTPIINDWLGGTLVSIPVRVTGPFADPTVTPLSPTAVGSSLMNLMKRTVNLPIKIVEPLWKKDP